MSTRMSNTLAVGLLLAAVALRLWQITLLPPGLNPSEIEEIRIAETARQGRVEVFYDLNGEGREGLYEVALAIVTGAVGGGLLGYRLLSVLLGLLMLALVYALVKRLYSPLAALLALALLVFNMWSILLARMIARETLLPLLLTAVMLALAIILIDPPERRSPSRNAPFFVLGVLMGIGFYIHPTNFLITLMSMLFIAYMLLSRQPLTRRKLGFIGFAIVIMAVLAMPYIISSVRLPQLAGTQRLFADFPATWAGSVNALLDGTAGFFFVGDLNPLVNVPRRPLIDLMSGLFVVIGLLVAVWHWRQPRFALPCSALLVLLPPALLTQGSPNWLHFSVLLPLVALLFGVGVTAVYDGLPRRTRRFVPLGLVGLLVFNSVWVTRDLFDSWGALPPVQTAYQGRLAQLAHHLDSTAATTPSLICAQSLREGGAQSSLTDAELLTLMMHRQNAAVRFANCGTGLVLANGGERTQVILPSDDTLATAHEYILDWLMQGDLASPPSAPAESIIILKVAPQLADTIGRFTTTARVSYPPEAPGGMVSTLPPVRFGGNITFLGYEPIQAEPFNPGDYLTLATYWRVDGTVPADLRLFTHLLLDPSEVAAQTDTISVLPAQLQPRDVFVQVTFVRIPFGLPGGRYAVSIGAYEDSSDMRLGVFDEASQPRGTRLFLGEIIVAG